MSEKEIGLAVLVVGIGQLEQLWQGLYWVG